MPKVLGNSLTFLKNDKATQQVPNPLAFINLIFSRPPWRKNVYIGVI